MLDKSQKIPCSIQYPETSIQYLITIRTTTYRNLT